MLKLFGHLFGAPFKLIGGFYKTPKKISRSIRKNLGNMLFVHDIDKIFKGKK